MKLIQFYLTDGFYSEIMIQSTLKDIKKTKKLIKWSAYNLNLNPIENIWENIKYYLGSKTFSSISS